MTATFWDVDGPLELTLVIDNREVIASVSIEPTFDDEWERNIVPFLLGEDLSRLQSLPNVLMRFTAGADGEVKLVCEPEADVGAIDAVNEISDKIGPLFRHVIQVLGTLQRNIDSIEQIQEELLAGISRNVAVLVSSERFLDEPIRNDSFHIVVLDGFRRMFHPEEGPDGNESLQVAIICRVGVVMDDPSYRIFFSEYTRRCLQAFENIRSTYLRRFAETLRSFVENATQRANELEACFEAADDSETINS